MINKIAAITSLLLLGTSVATTFCEQTESEGSCTEVNVASDHDAFKSMKQISKENNFTIEEHVVTTSDGYILSLFRIPGHLHEK